MKRLLFLLLFVASTGQAQGILSDQDSLANAAMELCGLPVAGSNLIDTFYVNNAVNWAVLDVSTDLPGAIPRVDTLVLTVGKMIYDMSTFTDSTFTGVSWVVKIGSENDNAINIPLKRVSFDSIYFEKGKQGLVILDRNDITAPSVYNTHGRALYLAPTPLAADTLVVGYGVAEKSLVNSDTTKIYPTYRTLIPLRAAYYINIRRGLFNEATAFDLQYQTAVERMRRKSRSVSYQEISSQ